MATAGVAPGRRWRNTDVVGQRDELRVRRLWMWLLGAILALLPATAYLAQLMEHARAQIAIESIRADLDRLADRERRLRIERSSLEALARVERSARRDLGLASPSRVVVLPRPGTSADQLVADGGEPADR